MRRRKDLHPVLFRTGLVGILRWMAYRLHSRSTRRWDRLVNGARAAAIQALSRGRETASRLRVPLVEWREERVRRTSYQQAPIARWWEQ